MNYEILAKFFAAMYVSEGWHEHWLRTGRLHSRARCVVMFDRVLNSDAWKEQT